MKLKLVALAAALIVSACSAADDGATVQSQDGAEAASNLVATTVKGTVASIVHRAEDGDPGAPGDHPPALGLTWTEVNLAFTLGCTDQFGPVESLETTEEGKTKLLVTATALVEKKPSAKCKAPQIKTHTIRLSGYRDEKDVAVQFMSAASTEAPADAISLHNFGQVNVVSVSPLCPEGAICVLNGTRVKLSLTVGSCVDAKGPVTFAAKQADDGTATLAIGGAAIATKKSLTVLCAAIGIRQHEISLPGIFVSSPDQLKLQQLQ